MSTKHACKSDTDDVAGASILVFQTVQYSFADYCRELGRDYERRGDVRGGGAISTQTVLRDSARATENRNGQGEAQEAAA